MDIALITGASRGLGRALARGWPSAATGSRSTRVVRRARRGRRGAAETTGAGRHARAGDVADAAHRDELRWAAAVRWAACDALELTRRTLGPSPSPIWPTTRSRSCAGSTEVNVVAPARRSCRWPCQRFAPARRRGHRHLRRGGRALRRLGRLRLVEGRARAAVGVLAVEHPALRVYWFDPGDMRTPMHQEAFPGEDISDRPRRRRACPALLRLPWRPAGGALHSAPLEAARVCEAVPRELPVPARGPPARAARRARGTWCACWSAAGDGTRARTPRFGDLPRLLAGRPGGGEHVGDAPGRARRRRPAAALGCTCPPRSPDGEPWAGGAAPAGRLGTLPFRGRPARLRGGAARRRPARDCCGAGRGCGTARLDLPGGLHGHLSAHGRPIRYRYAGRRLADLATTRPSTRRIPGAPRCRAPGARSRPSW